MECLEKKLRLSHQAIDSYLTFHHLPLSLSLSLSLSLCLLLCLPFSLSPSLSPFLSPFFGSFDRPFSFRSQPNPPCQRTGNQTFPSYVIYFVYRRQSSSLPPRNGNVSTNVHVCMHTSVSSHFSGVRRRSDDPIVDCIGSVAGSFSGDLAVVVDGTYGLPKQNLDRWAIRDPKTLSQASYIIGSGSRKSWSRQPLRSH